MISLSEPYEPRTIRFLELWSPLGWRMKVYGIVRSEACPRPDLVLAAKEIALDLLENRTTQHSHYGVGFVGIHEGRGANFVFVDWWADENELHHHVFISSSDDLLSLKEKTRDDPTACVWDLGVLAHEREAWVDTVLANPKGPDPDAYLARQMNREL